MASGSALTWSPLLLVLLVADFAQALVSDGTVLRQFKSNVMDFRGFLDDWDNGSEDPCDPGFTWTGVSCSNDTEGRLTVTGLDLKSRLLAGTISEQLADLQYLQRLLLSSNSFSGQIPGNIGELQQLLELDLGDNQLTDSIPLLPPKVQRLSLQNNFLDGDIDRTNLHNLTLYSLDLHGNRFTGRLPDMNTPKMESLERLDVSNNQFEGLLPVGLESLNVSYCNISDNKFEDEIPGGRWAMKIIDLSRNQLKGNIPSALLMGSSLSYLNCSSNSLDGFVDLNLSDSQPSRLKFLDLSNNGFVGVPVIGSQMAEGLEYLYLQNNHFTGQLEELLRRNFSNLRELRLGGNIFFASGSRLAHASADIHFPLLQVMDLSSNYMDGGIPSELFRTEKLQFLRVLDLSNNGLGGGIPVSLSQLPNLRELRLRNSDLQGEIELGENWTNLTILDLSLNSFDYTNTTLQVILETFSNLKELRLGLKNVHSHLALPTRVGKLPSLEILELNNCSLVGNISGQYTRNDLLPSLKILNLANNQLEGSLPTGFGEMPLLIELDVSNNKLTGQLPDFRFHIFNETAFKGNEGLCGPQKICSTKSSHLKLVEIIIIGVVSFLVTGGSFLFLGWIWRRRIDAKVHQQDVELIAVLLDREATTLMSLRELRRATDDFSQDSQIGVGGFGTVYRGTLDDGTEVAIKKSKRDGSSSEEKRQFLNEVKILSQVHHRHLVRLLGCCLANKNALLVFEFVRNGTLEEHLKKGRGASPMSWESRLRIAVQTAGALDYLHSSANPPIYHMDVKTANILLDDKMNAKVADFGISKLAPALDATHITTLHGFQGTFGYMDPESVVSSMLTGKSDVYALGVVLLELITAKTVVDRSRGANASLVTWALPLVKNDSLEEIIDPTIFDTFLTPDGRDSIMDVARLAERCLQFKSALRPSTKDVFTDLLIIQQQFDVKNTAEVDPLTVDSAAISPIFSFSSSSEDAPFLAPHPATPAMCKDWPSSSLDCNR